MYFIGKSVRAQRASLPRCRAEFPCSAARMDCQLLFLTARCARWRRAMLENTRERDDDSIIRQVTAARSPSGKAKVCKTVQDVFATPSKSVTALILRWLDFASGGLISFVLVCFGLVWGSFGAVLTAHRSRFGASFRFRVRDGSLWLLDGARLLGRLHNGRWRGNCLWQLSYLSFSGGI